MTDQEFEAAIYAAVLAAIEAIGIDAFRATSFFGSNTP